VETPSLVVPTADSELLVSGKAFGGVGLRLKAGGTSSSPATMSMVSRVVGMIQTMPEKISIVLEDRDVVPWSPGALDGVDSSWGFGNSIVEEVCKVGQTVGEEDRVVET
jgi:hypothetical protein